MTRSRSEPYVLCDPAHAKATWTFHKSQFVWKFTGNTRDNLAAATVSCEPAQSKCTWTFHQSHFVWKFTGKLPNAITATPVLCEPARSKCTWTFHKHKSHILRGNLQAKRDGYHLDWSPGLPLEFINNVYIYIYTYIYHIRIYNFHYSRNNCFLCIEIHIINTSILCSVSPWPIYASAPACEGRKCCSCKFSFTSI